MKIQALIAAIAILAIFPVVSNAQGFNNINVNLNDVMVSQRNMELSRQLNDANASMTFAKKKHHKKDKKHQLAHVQDAAVVDQNAANNTTETAAPAMNTEAPKL